jgi:hypothetical protein
MTSRCSRRRWFAREDHRRSSARPRHAWRNLTFVVVSTDHGIDGVSEVRMINNTGALLGYLADGLAVPLTGAALER